MSLSRAALPCVKLALLHDALAEALAQLGQGVELARDLREVVVRLGQLALLDGLDDHRDLGVFAGVVAADEGRAEVRLLARGQRVDRLVDALEQLAGADFVRHALGAVDLGAVDRGDQVELDEVTGGRGAVDGHERAEAGAQSVELLVDRSLVDLDRVDLDSGALEGRKIELGPYVDLDLDEQVAGEVLLVRPFLHVGARLAENPQLVRLDGLAVERVETLADGVLDHGRATDALVDDRRGNLALAESGDLHVLRDVLVRVSDARLELIGRDRDVQLHPGRGELLDGAVDHACSFSL